jgi:hypothetical protein
MKKIILIIALLVISMPVWALKPMGDVALSRVSGPDSLSVKTPERARLVLHKPVKKEAFKGIGKTILEEAGVLCDMILYGDSDIHDKKSFPRWSLNVSFFPRNLDYRDIYDSASEFESDQAKGKFGYDIALNNRMNASYSLSDPIGSDHSIYYLLGSYRRSDEPVTWVTKPYGGPEMRNHYLNNTSTAVQPKSWVDIKTN